jgi:release factor glutamine methyltransferase
MTLQEHVHRGRLRLEQAGIDANEAGLDAELLAREVLSWDLAAVLARSHEPAPDGFPARYDARISRRERREPISYILGRREFWGLDFEVGPGVLTPRPETEFIVEEAIERFAGPRHAKAGADAPLVSAHPSRIADVGTGSGCLAISLALEFPAARLVATDISTAALDVARRNAKRHRVGDRIELSRTSLLTGVAGPFDLIVSNPPYVASGDVADLPPEVRDYEPREALDGGADGLDVIRKLLAEAGSHLVPGGWLVFEFGFGQEEGVKDAVARVPHLRLDRVRADLQGIPRTAVVRSSSR